MDAPPNFRRPSPVDYNQKTALLIDITDHDGNYIQELLSQKGYQIWYIRKKKISDSIIDLIKFELFDRDISQIKSLDVFIPMTFDDDNINEIETIGILQTLNDLKLLGCSTMYQMYYFDLVNVINNNFEPKLKRLFTPFQQVRDFCNDNKLLLSRPYRGIIGSMPLFVSLDRNKFDIMSVEEVFNLFLSKSVESIFLWSLQGWTEITSFCKLSGNDREIKGIISKNSFMGLTSYERVIMENNLEKDTKDLLVGDRVLLSSLPNSDPQEVSNLQAEFIGLVVGGGNWSAGKIRFSTSDNNLCSRVLELWEQICDQSKEFPEVETTDSHIEFDVKWIKDRHVFTITGRKKVPKSILNSTVSNKEHFLKGYNLACGLKKNKCIYEFKNFKTNSPLLASGLICLLNQTTKQQYNINVEEKQSDKGKKLYYSINFLSDSRFSKSQSLTKKQIVEEKLKQGLSEREISRQTKISRNFIKSIRLGGVPKENDVKVIDNKKIKKIIDYGSTSEDFYSLTVTTGNFLYGIGRGFISCD